MLHKAIPAPVMELKGCIWPILRINQQPVITFSFLGFFDKSKADHTREKAESALISSTSAEGEKNKDIKRRRRHLRDAIPFLYVEYCRIGDSSPATFSPKDSNLDGTSIVCSGGRFRILDKEESPTFRAHILVVLIPVFVRKLVVWFE